MARAAKKPDSKHLIAPGQFDNLLILDSEVDLITPAEMAVLEEIKDRTNVAMPFFPASSCRRHVFIFQASDVNAALTPKLCAFMESKASDHRNIRLHRGIGAMNFLLVWMSGGLHKGKHYNDTYNRKTVNIGFDIYKRMLELSIAATSKEDFDKATEREAHRLDQAIGLFLESKTTTDEKAAAGGGGGGGADSAETSKSPKSHAHLEDELRWMQSAKDEFIRIRRLGINRFRDTKHKTDFLTFVCEVQITTNLLCSVFDKVKNEEGLRALWSGSITKPVLEEMARDDGKLFGEIIRCRQDFISDLGQILVTLSQTTGAAELFRATLGNISPEMREKITVLSERAKKFAIDAREGKSGGGGGGSTSGSVAAEGAVLLDETSHDKKHLA